MDTRFPFVDWFRNSSPYINAHRGRTFVILIEGEAMARGRGEQLVQDLALLHTLGVRLVVVFGIRPQVQQALEAAGITPGQHQGRWVADAEVMGCIERVAAEQLLWLEARFSLGLPNTPMHGVELTAVSGNLVMAKPLGVREGVDFDHSGEVRRVRTQAIEGLLEKGALVVLPPLGFSSTGEVFDLDASDVAQHAAMTLSADKLILLRRGQRSVRCQRSAAAPADSRRSRGRCWPRRRPAVSWRAIWRPHARRPATGWRAPICSPGMTTTPCSASSSPVTASAP